jgi:hypothetical protein
LTSIHVTWVGMDFVVCLLMTFGQLVWVHGKMHWLWSIKLVMGAAYINLYRQGLSPLFIHFQWPYTKKKKNKALLLSSLSKKKSQL